MPDAARFLELMKVDTPLHQGREQLDFPPTHDTPEQLRKLYEQMEHQRGCVELDGFEVSFIG